MGERAPQAVLCLDAFHVVASGSAALDAVRRGMWNQLRAAGKKDQAKTLLLVVIGLLSGDAMPNVASARDDE